MTPEAIAAEIREHAVHTASGRCACGRIVFDRSGPDSVAGSWPEHVAEAIAALQA